MKDSLAHLPQRQRGELARIASIIRQAAPQAEMIRQAYIGARYDMHYKITKQQLEQLAPCVKKLHEVTEKVCKEKIESFV